MHQGENLRKFLSIREIKIKHFADLEVTPSRATISRDLEEPKIELKYRLLYAYVLNIHVDSFTEGKMISLTKGLAEVISTSLVKDRNYHKYLKLYFKTIENEIKKVNSSITIVDYMKNNFQSANGYLRSEYAKTYHPLYSSYLEQIEDRLLFLKSHNQKIKYHRFYQVPVREIRGDVFGGDKILCGIDMIFSGTIKHFIRLWDAKVDAKMYLLRNAIRPTSYLMIDDKVILSEYIKYDEDGFSRPDILFVDRKQSGSDTTSIPARLIQTYQYEMSAKNLPPESRLTLTPELMVKNLRKILMCYESVVNGTEITAENQNRMKFYEGRVEVTEKKIELLKPYLK